MPKPKKPQSSRKQKHLGKACRRGQPVYYNEVKKSVNLSLTPTAIKQLEKLADSQQISRSEVLERWLRSHLESPE